MIDGCVLFGATRRSRRALPAAGARGAARGGPAAARLRASRARARGAGREAASGGSPSERLEEHAADVPARRARALMRSLRYRPVDVDRSGERRRGPRRGRPAPVAAYLALPPGRLPACGERSRASGSAGGQPDRAREAVRRGPRRAPSRSTGSLAEVAGERASRRSSASTTSSAWRPCRTCSACAANPVLDAVWNGEHIEQVEILWEETLALEGRAGYYDRCRGAQGRDAEPHAAGPVPGRDGAAGEPRRARPARPQGRRPALGPAARRATTPLRARGAPATRPAGSADRDVPAYADEEGVDPSARHRDLRRGRLSSSTPAAGAARVSCCAPARRCEGAQGSRRPLPSRQRARPWDPALTSLGRDRRSRRIVLGSPAVPSGLRRPPWSSERPPRNRSSCLRPRPSRRPHWRQRVLGRGDEAEGLACDGAGPRGLAGEPCAARGVPGGFRRARLAPSLAERRSRRRGWGGDVELADTLFSAPHRMLPQARRRRSPSRPRRPCGSSQSRLRGAGSRMIRSRRPAGDRHRSIDRALAYVAISGLGGELGEDVGKSGQLRRQDAALLPVRR